MSFFYCKLGDLEDSKRNLLRVLEATLGSRATSVPATRPVRSKVPGHAGASLSRTKLIVAGGPAGRGPALVFQPQPLLMAWPDPFRQPEAQACLARRPGCASHDSDVSVHNIMSDPGLELVVTRISLVLRARDGVPGQLVVVIQVACGRRTVLASLL